jgi:hypothetical protein
VAVTSVHTCSACPQEVRDLYATAHNAVGALDRGDGADRVYRKLAELRASLDRFQSVVDQHFAELDRL